MSEKVSVIIPSYNSGKYIKRTLLSVLNQTYTNLEIIVVNDASNDNSESIINECIESDSRIRLINNLKNLGLSATRNVGLKHSLGDYFAFIDSDDVWINNKLEVQINELKKGYDFIFNDYDLIDVYDTIITNISPPQRHSLVKDLKTKILTNNYILGSGSSVLIKKEVFQKVGFFNESLSFGEDWEYWCRIIREGFEFSYIDKKLTKIRIHNESMQSISTNLRKYENEKAILTSFKKLKGINNTEQTILNYELAERCLKYQIGYFEMVRFLNLNFKYKEERLKLLTKIVMYSFKYIKIVSKKTIKQLLKI